MKSKYSFFLIACIILIIYSLFLMVRSPTRGFEASIYLSTPLFVWLSLFFCIVGSAIIILYKINLNKYTKFELSMFFGLIIWCNFILLSIHLMRGYFFWDAVGDAGHHIGWINDLLVSGHINDQNFYPVLHIIVSQICLFTNLDCMIISQWLVVIFELLTFLFMYILSTVIFENKNKIIISTLLGTILLLGWYINVTPQRLSILFFPLIIYLLFKFSDYRKSEVSFLILLITIFYIPFHILSSFVVSIFIVGFILWNIIYFKNIFETQRYLLLVLFLSLIGSVAWLLHFNYFQGNIIHTFDLIENGIVQNSINSLSADASQAQRYGYNIWEYAIKTQSGNMILHLFFIGAIICLWLKNEDTPEQNKLKLLSFFTIAFFGILLANTFIKFSFSFGRILSFFYFIEIVLAAYFIYELIIFSKNSRNIIKKLVPICIMVLISIMYLNGILLIYTSSFTSDISFQNTHAEISGIDWFFTKKDTNVDISAWYFAPEPYSMFVLNEHERETRNDLSRYTLQPFSNHFGYSEYTTFGGQFTTDVYLLISKKLQTIYSDIRPEMAQYRLLNSDFNRLNFDSSINKIFNNNDINVYLFKPKRIAR